MDFKPNKKNGGVQPPPPSSFKRFCNPISTTKALTPFVFFKL